MGWNSANEIFDPVARELGLVNISDADKTRVLAVLIREMQALDWDTEDESLEEFAGDEAVVEAFRRNKVILECGAQGKIGEETVWCERERGPRFHADGQHSDEEGHTWLAYPGEEG